MPSFYFHFCPTLWCMIRTDMKIEFHFWHLYPDITEPRLWAWVRYANTCIGDLNDIWIRIKNNDYLKFAWQFTSPCTAGVNGGISKWDRRRRNIPGGHCQPRCQQKCSATCCVGWFCLPHYHGQTTMIVLLRFCIVHLTSIKKLWNAHIFCSTCNTRYSSGWREKPTSFGSSVGWACFAQANSILLWRGNTQVSIC